MEYLHAAGILHGDLKPANVLLKSTSADRRGYICKLCDFGLSRLLDAAHATHVSTQTYGVSFLNLRYKTARQHQISLVDNLLHVKGPCLMEGLHDG